jgi:acetolactate synthase-1/2/3 large subunit
MDDSTEGSLHGITSMMRVADYIARTLAANGVRHVFMVTGGGAMHLNDAFGRCEGLAHVCCHHEQACAMAAESYARITGRPAAVNVTTGPGGINALNGVFGAWTDSIPMIVVSGQVKRETCLYKHGLIGKLRQLGDQEADVLSMVKGITKYAVTIDDPASIRYHLERALHLARSGRPGPTWIDVPVDVQGSAVDPAALRAYDPREDAITWETPDLDAACDAILARVSAAKRPVVYAGSGVWLSGAHRAFLEVIERFGAPVVTAWNSNDLLANDHPLFAGRPGTIGDRAGNFAVQNADVLLVLGSRLNIRLVSYAWEHFAPRAFKIAVDIDPEEMRKPTARIDLPVHADLRELFRVLLTRPALERTPARREWLAWCLERRRRYPVVLPEYWENEESVNPYCFMDELFRQLVEDEIVVCADGTACVTAFQAATIKKGQRLFHNSGCASMGYDLPAAVGAAFARPGQRVVCLAGDGSIMMNLQELQTIAGFGLPVKLFVLDNRGYHSIRQTQDNFFPGRAVGCGTESGLTFPEWERVAHAFGLAFTRCATHADLPRAVEATLGAPEASMCEVVLDLRQQFAPKTSSRRLEDGRMVTAPLHDMAPFLDRDELASNLIEPWEDT